MLGDGDAGRGVVAGVFGEGWLWWSWLLPSGGVGEAVDYGEGGDSPLSPSLLLTITDSVECGEEEEEDAVASRWWPW